MRISRLVLAAAAGVTLIAGSAATAASGDDDAAVRAKLTGYEEVPAISTLARGKFHATLEDDQISYTLRYKNLTTPAQQAHIHVGQSGVNGNVSAFLCSNVAGSPAGTPTCPTSGEVTGVITAASVIGPSAQGIAPGELAELLSAIDAGVAYVNVHNATYPGGEIRGQLEEHDD